MYAILDLYSRKIVAHKISFSSTTQLVTKTFKQAYATRRPSEGLMFHSDRGSQFVSNTLRKMMKEYSIIQSFSKPYNPYNNSVIESFFSTLKQEEIYRSKYKSEAEMIASINKYIDFYNNERPHKTNKYLTPFQKEQNYNKSLLDKGVQK